MPNNQLTRVETSLMISRDQVFRRFNEVGLRPTALASFAELQSSLNKLNGSPFRSETLEDIYSACDNRTADSVPLSAFAGKVVEAQTLLVDRIGKSKSIIQSYREELDRIAQEEQIIEGNSRLHRDFDSQRQRYNALMEERSKQLDEYEEDLKLLRVTFVPDILVEKEVSPTSERSALLPWLEALSYFLILFEITVSFARPDFVNLLGVSLLFLMFQANYYDQKYNKCTLIVMGLGFLWDILWLSIKFARWTGVDSLHIGQLYSQGGALYSYCAIMTIILLPVKLAALILLFMFKGAPERDYSLWKWSRHVGGQKPEFKFFK